MKSTFTPQPKNPKKNPAPSAPGLGQMWSRPPQHFGPPGGRGWGGRGERPPCARRRGSIPLAKSLPEAWLSGKTARPARQFTAVGAGQWCTQTWARAPASPNFVGRSRRSTPLQEFPSGSPGFGVGRGATAAVGPAQCDGGCEATPPPPSARRCWSGVRRESGRATLVVNREQRN